MLPFFYQSFSIDQGNGAAHQNTCPANDGFVAPGLGIRNKVQRTRIFVEIDFVNENEVQSTAILDF